MIDKTNRNISVPNMYRLYDMHDMFIREERIETKDYAVVDLYRKDGVYYVRRGNWKLHETELVDGDNVDGNS